MSDGLTGGAGSLTAEGVIAEYYESIYRIALGLSANRSDAEDIAQEVCVAVLRGLPKFRGDARITTWLYRITFRVATRWLARRRRSVELPESLAAADSTLPLDLMRALDRLSFDARMVILLVSVEGMTHAEAAAILAVPEGTVASRLHTARRRLAALLGGESCRQLH